MATARRGEAVGDKKPLTGKQVDAIVVRRLRRFEKLNFLKSFAMFMGKAQLVELGLKNILMDKYGCDQKSVER